MPGVKSIAMLSLRTTILPKKWEPFLVPFSYQYPFRIFFIIHHMIFLKSKACRI